MAFTGNYMCTSFKKQLLQAQHNFDSASTGAYIQVGFVLTRRNF